MEMDAVDASPVCPTFICARVPADELFEFEQKNGDSPSTQQKHSKMKMWREQGKILG